MLILPDGYAKWNEKINMFATGEVKPTSNWYEDGKLKDGDVKEERVDCAPPDGGWVLPKFFCPACGRKDYELPEGEEPAPGMYKVNPDEVLPGLQLTPDSVVIYWCCPECVNEFTKADVAMRRAYEMAQRDAEQVVADALAKPKSSLLSLPGVTSRQIVYDQSKKAFDERMESELLKNKRAVSAARKQESIKERIFDWIRSQHPDDRLEATPDV